MIGRLIYGFLIGGLLSGCASVVVTPVTIVKDNNDTTKLSSSGLFYVLPRTVITIDVSAKVTEVRESQFYLDLVKATREYRELQKQHSDLTESQLEKTEDFKKCAESLRTKLFDRAPGISLVPKDRFDPSPRYKDIRRKLAAVGVSLTDTRGKNFSLEGATVGSRAEPDPGQIYMVKIKGWFLQDRSFVLDLSESGLITSGEAEVTDKTIDVVVKTVDLAAQIAGRAIKPGALTAWKQGSDDAEEERFNEVFAHAEAVLSDLRSADDRRWGLASGQTTGVAGGLPVATLERMLLDLASLRQGLAAYFSSIKVYTLSTQYAYRPTGDSTVAVFTFADDGISATGHGAGVEAPPLPARFRSEKLAKSREDPKLGMTSVTIDIKRDADSGGRVAETIAARRHNASIHGFVYRIPGSGRITLAVGDDSTRTILPVAQFGTIAALPSSTGSITNKYTLAYYKDTGALKNIKVLSKSLDPAVLDKLSASAATIQKAKNESEDELLKLQRQRQILDEQKKIRDLETELAK